VAAFALVVLAIGAAYYFITGYLYDRQLERVYAEMDADDPNWRWPDLVAELKAPPDEENSAKHLLKVADLLVLKPFDRAGTWPGTTMEKALAIRNARLSPEHIKTLSVHFSKLDPDCLNEARKLKDMPEGRFAIPADVDNVFALNLDWIQKTREVIHVLYGDAVLRGQGDVEGAAETCLAMIHVCHSINDHPFLISQLVRIAEQHITFVALERLLAQGELKEPTLARLQAALEREAAANTFHLGMRGERAGTAHFFKAVREGKTSLGVVMAGSRNPAMGERVLDAFPGLVLRGQAEHLSLMNEMTQVSKLTGPERAAALAKVDAKVRKSWTWSVRLLMPAVTKVADASDRSQAMLRCAVAAFAAERYRLRHQAWPASLKDLVGAGLLKEIPLDPYDGKPLRLLKTPGGGVLIYSIGRDKIDNGGKLDRMNPYNNGTDAGFELWRPSMRGIEPPVFEEKDQ
jgi:hypothetical protein